MCSTRWRILIHLNESPMFTTDIGTRIKTRIWILEDYLSTICVYTFQCTTFFLVSTFFWSTHFSYPFEVELPATHLNTLVYFNQTKQYKRHIVLKNFSYLNLKIFRQAWCVFAFHSTKRLSENTRDPRISAYRMVSNNSTSNTLTLLWFPDSVLSYLHVHLYMNGTRPAMYEHPTSTLADHGSWFTRLSSSDKIFFPASPLTLAETTCATVKTEFQKKKKNNL